MEQQLWKFSLFLAYSIVVLAVAKNNLSPCKNHEDCKSARRVGSVVNLNAITFKSADSFKQCRNSMIYLPLPSPVLHTHTLVVVGKKQSFLWLASSPFYSINRTLSTYSFVAIPCLKRSLSSLFRPSQISHVV